MLSSLCYSVDSIFGGKAKIIHNLKKRLLFFCGLIYNIESKIVFHVHFDRENGKVLTCMTEFDVRQIDKEKKVFFVGIGGISMSALAHILKNDGFCVAGSDFKESETVASLRAMGIPVAIGHKEENVEGAGLVVYTAAVKKDNPELVAAGKLGIPAIERATLLGAMMKNYKYPVAVSGTHGKTTATSMLAHVLCGADMDPTILVGGVLPLIGGNMRDGGKDYFVTEACEYCGSFLKFFPLYSIILNVEEDHLDYFKDLDDIIACFKKFVEKTPESGAVIANFDDENVRRTVENSDKKIISFGTEWENADYGAKNIVFGDDGFAEFDVVKQGETYIHVKLNVPGMHNVKNALAVTAAADLLGAGGEAIQKGFLSFKGTNRRFELKGEMGGVKIIDDYAHHPTEVKATLKAAKTVAGENKVWCVFQPHTYTRSLALKDEFAAAFADCDFLVITDIYAAREKDTGLIHAKDLADVINANSGNALYIKEFSDIAAYFKENAKPGDLVITMGAGDVYKIGELLV